MRKIILPTLIGAFVLGIGSANAATSFIDQYGVATSVFNPVYRSMQNNWAVQSEF